MSSSERYSPSEDEEGDSVSWYFDDSTQEVVDVPVTSEFTGAQRQTEVDQCDHHPVTTRDKYVTASKYLSK